MGSQSRCGWVPLPSRVSYIFSRPQLLLQTQVMEKRLRRSKVMELMGIR